MRGNIRNHFVQEKIADVWEVQTRSGENIRGQKEADDIKKIYFMSDQVGMLIPEVKEMTL